MSFAAKKHEEKPYNKCLDCEHIGINCDGPNFLAMTTERWCEWCHLRKEHLDWTNAYVAELAGVSKISVDRVMSGNVKDLRISTMQSITKALVNGSWGQYPCAMAEAAKHPDTDHECKRLKSALEMVTAEHKAELKAAHDDTEKRLQYLKDQIAFKEQQMAAKDKLLDERYDFLKRKDRNIAILSTMLTISVLVIITALVMDRLNPDIGFFWLGQMFSPKGFSFTDLFGSL